MIRATAWSAATPERLWAIASDVERWGERLPTVHSVRALDSGPTGPGSRFVVRQPGLPRATWEVTDWQPGRSFTWVSSSPGIRSTAVHDVREDGDGSRLDLALEWSGPLARVLELLIGRRARGMVETEARTFAMLAEGRTATAPGRPARLPPRWFVVAFWHGHRALLRATGGRLGLWRPRPGGWGTLRLTTTGRRSGQPRQVVVGYIEDGRDLVTMAMNGWGAPEPAWWLNLQAHPEAVAQTRDGVLRVRGRRAQGEERARLWARWAEVHHDLDEYAARRPTETAVVVLEPRDDPGA
jgi:F420H(2)-dependent quinone reductase